MKKLLERRQNGKSLKELSITAGDVIKIETANVDELPKCHLLDEPSGTPTFKFEKVLHKWWNMYSRKTESQEELMTAEDIFKLFQEHLSRNTLKEQEALEIVTNFGTNQRLNYAQFIMYFIERTRTNLTEMWRMLNLHGYRNDLRYKEEMDFILPVETLARQILSNDTVYDMLFSMLDNPVLKPVHTDLYKFLCGLPTSPRILESISGKDFNPAVLLKVGSSYKLSYLTTVIMHNLTHSVDQLFLFAERGGIECICNKLESFGFDRNGNIYDVEDKNMLASLLKILITYSMLSLSTDEISFTLADEKLNSMELWEFVNKLDKQMKQPSEDSIKNALQFVERVTIDFNRINILVNAMLRSLIIHYKNNYSKEVTVEVSRLCTLMSRFNPPDIETLLMGLLAESLNLRRACMNLIFMQGRLHKEKVLQLLERLLSMLPEEEVKYGITQYIELTCRMLLEHSTSETKD
jgi:hypothetical protein